MAGVFKTFLSNDSVATRTLLNEAVALTGSLISGASDANVKTYSHSMFESVFDSDYTSSSANHWFDITIGYASGSTWLDPADTDATKKQIIYNQLAGTLMGHDITGSILQFDADGDISGGGTKYTEIVAIPFARVLNKDEIKRGSFTFKLGTDSFADPFATTSSLTDDVTNYRVNSPAGEYGIVTDGSSNAGLLFYQAGVLILDLNSVFGSLEANVGGDTFTDLSASSIETLCEGVRHYMEKFIFNNTLELNSTVYFCRLNHNDFNYSSNPTYLSGSRIRVKNNPNDLPSSYITSVGLYGADNSLLAVGKLSTPIVKNPQNELILRVMLSY